MIILKKNPGAPESYVETYGGLFDHANKDMNGISSLCVLTDRRELLKLTRTRSAVDGLALTTIRLFYRGYSGDGSAKWMGPIISVVNIDGEEEVFVEDDVDHRIPEHLKFDPETALDAALFDRVAMNKGDRATF